MSAAPGPPGPIDCLRRGLVSLRANWELAAATFAQLLLTTGLLVAGFMILLTGLGVSLAAWLRDLGPDWPRQLADDLAMSLETGPPELLPLVLPLIAATLVWTLAFCLYCYLQGGVVGVVVEAEMAAGSGLPGWRAFRSFSMSGFDRHGRQLFWRYFWFNHLVAAVALVWSVLLLGLVALAVGLATGPDTTVGVALGCFGLGPLGLLLVAGALWSLLASVEVARPGTGVWVASRKALGELRRRLGPLLVIWLLWLAASLVLGAAFAPLEMALSVAAGDRLALWLGGRGALLAARSLLACGLFVAVVAALAALLGMRRAPAVEAAG